MVHEGSFLSADSIFTFNLYIVARKYIRAKATAVQGLVKFGESQLARFIRPNKRNKGCLNLNCGTLENEISI